MPDSLPQLLRLVTVAKPSMQEGTLRWMPGTQIFGAAG